MKTPSTATTRRQSSEAIISLPRLQSHYDYAEAQFETLLETEGLDQKLATHRPIIQVFERTLNQALATAYTDTSSSEAAQRFLHRILYRINRLKLFWYDELKHYENERSNYLRGVREQIEAAWQTWEMNFFDMPALKAIDVGESLAENAKKDLNPEPSDAGLFFRDHAGRAGYRRLLEISALDGLVEASQLSRMLGGVGNKIHSKLTKLFLEEYGGGRLSRKHSTFFAAMLNHFGMQTKPEAYLDAVPWEVLAGINHSFLLSERKRFFLRYIGGLLYTEISVPSAFRNYLAAATRLDLPQAAMGYWDLHIKEDVRHGQWMLHDVALPLAKRYPDDAWELVLGYHQQRLISRRAGEAIARSAHKADADNLETA